ncbi:amino acid transporter YHC3 [Kluyveromyces lactis]|uniref:Protein BTN1 n=1 Tax=Kluyveromyces lactis (strain ATCC 8585 / CBS 2359 / DSM 70799 / NBRC 1267 / NRRL Y-1140 / WM37) TaxID=284590 RepID=BTN1_KLULA|nr:uncharacterized protein KLLA0_F01551g [Kluyveromyces lactis]Q6CLN9.1 RecName: Full=Protein BTN1; Flags: Precursor [Kluyveromyces lactis NRRL Y-1140]CAG97857.1 KLLA0F01551p [Kluyveromyces lactis]|eukprot:XP_455150.1 uncharacterized protein KLLA0_F01551g [Kluyveromyces lactis]
MELDRDKKTFAYFWLFGLINNILYVVILSAASDIIGPSLPKSIVLLFDIMPSFLIKLSAPFFVHSIHYDKRIPILILLSMLGIILVSTRSLWLCLPGIVLASLSSGFGEITFLQLTHFFGSKSLTGWSSGTGGAGIVGSFSYLLLTTVFRLNIQLSLLLYAALPLIFLLYYKINDSIVSSQVYQSLDMPIDSSDGPIELLKSNGWVDIVKRLSKLVIPYMIPLSTVYLFEYLINQGVAPTLLFPIDTTPFVKYRDIYVTYGTLYQLGVFISRTWGHKLPVKNLYLFSVLQLINLLITLSQSYYYWTDSISWIMVLIFYEGLIGGSSYVNCFMNILKDVDPNEREFVLGSVSISDSLGTLIAAFLGIILEPSLCKHQIGTGRPWCRME